MLRKRIFLNTAVNSGGKFLSFAFQIFIITYLIKTLGKEAYGMVVLALALVGNTNLIEAGFGLSVTKYVAEYKAKDDWKRLLEIVNTNFVVVTIIAVGFCSVLFIINEVFLEKIFTIPANFLQPAKGMIRILILLSFVEFWSVSIMRVLEGFQQFSVARGMEVLKWLLRLVFIILAVEKDYGLPGVGAAYFAAGIINLAILYLFAFSRTSRLKLNILLSNKESFKLLFGFSIWIFLSKAFAFISYRIDTIVIGIFLPLENLTYYNIAFKVFDVLRYGFSLISSTLVPVTSEIAAVMNKERISLLFRKASKYTILPMFPILIFFFFHSDKVIKLWIGSGFEKSVVLSQLFIASLFFTALVSSGSEMMTGMNKLKVLVKYNGVGSLINLVASVILVQKIGVYGVVVGTLIGSSIVSAGYLYQMMKEFSMSLIEYLKDIVVVPILLTIALGIMMLGFRSVWFGFFGVLIYYMVVFALIVDKEDKESGLKLFKAGYCKIMGGRITDNFKKLKWKIKISVYNQNVHSLMETVDKHYSANKGARLLDIGCNDGVYARKYCERFEIDFDNAYGVDYNEHKIKSLPRARFKQHDIDVLLSLPYENNYFDLIIMNQVLEHTKNISHIISDINRVLKKDGLFVVSVPNLAALHSRFLLLFGEMPFAIQGMDAHVRGFTMKALKRYVEEYNFECLDFTGGGLYPLTGHITRVLGRFFPQLSVFFTLTFKKTGDVDPQILEAKQLKRIHETNIDF